MEWLSKIMALCVLFSILYLILPEGNLKKISGTTMAIILSLQMLSPVFSFSDETISSLFLSLKVDQNLANDSAEDLTEIFDEYERKCVEEIQRYVVEQSYVNDCTVKVVINRDLQSDRLGCLDHVYLYVSFEKDNGADDPWIKPIEIILSDRWKEQGETPTHVNVLRDQIADWLSVDLSCITIFEKEDVHE